MEPQVWNKARLLGCVGPWVLATLLAACGSKSGPVSTADGGGSEDGGSDASTTGGSDAGTPIAHGDGGVDPLMNAEGHQCIPDNAGGKGSCSDPNAICSTWGVDQNNAPFATCMILCQTDADCAASKTGNTKCGLGVVPKVEGNNIAVSFRNMCVSAVLQEGQLASFDALNTDDNGAPLPMTGCAADLLPIPNQDLAVGSIFVPLFNYFADQGSCGRLCMSNADCKNPAAPVCSSPWIGLSSDTSTATQNFGNCVARKAGKGAQCSFVNVTKMCDPAQGLVCIGVVPMDADNTRDKDSYGQCTELCTAQAKCKVQVQPSLPPACLTGLFKADPTLGLCSDNCTSFPDNCTHDASAPPPGGTARGMSCQEVPNTRTPSVAYQKPIISLCTDVEQVGPVLPAYTGSGAATGDCFLNFTACPHGTFCDTQGSANTNKGACFYGCSTTTATASAICGAQTPKLTCKPEAPQGVTAPFGLCAP